MSGGASGEAMPEIPPEIERRLGRLEDKFADKVIFKDVHDRDVRRFEDQVASALKESTSATKAAADLITEQVKGVAADVAEIKEERRTMRGLIFGAYLALIGTIITGVLFYLLQANP